MIQTRSTDINEIVSLQVSDISTLEFIVGRFWRGPWFARRLSRWRTLATSAFLLLVAAAPLQAAQDFLEPDAAFRLSARVLGNNAIELRYDIAAGYYMYRERFAIDVAPAGAQLGPADYPAGQVKFDETFQKDVETHRGALLIVQPLTAATAEFKLSVTSQGCADAGLCYPPNQQFLKVSADPTGLKSARLMKADAGDAWTLTETPGFALTPTSTLPTAAALAQQSTQAPAPGNRPAAGGIDGALRSGHWWTVIGAFLLAGLLLSFTPCVLPMVPILSAIVVGEGREETPVTRRRSFALSVMYSLGMALVYTGLGVAAGLAGEGLAAALQTPWVLGSFALLMVLLSLSMFGVYELQLPNRWQSAMTERSQRLQGGRYAAVFLMGGLSALIIGPCVAAPLAGALVYISQTRDVVLGGTALFALACGMSVPLLLIGLSAGRLLPRAGKWMNNVKRFFGVLLLGVAIWMVAPIVPTMVSLMLWGTLAAFAGVLLPSFETLHNGAGAGHRLAKAAGLLLLLLGAAQWVGALSGGQDVLQPLKHLAMTSASGQRPSPGAAAQPRFTMVKSVEDLDAALKNAGKPILLDFYADWCISCHEMEKFTFTDDRVQARFAQALLLRADVTANDAQDRALLKRFGLFGPPGIVFFTPQGAEDPATRVIGYQGADEFLQSLARAGL